MNRNGSHTPRECHGLVEQHGIEGGDQDDAQRRRPIASLCGEPGEGERQQCADQPAVEIAEHGRARQRAAQPVGLSRRDQGEAVKGVPCEHDEREGQQTQHQAIHRLSRQREARSQPRNLKQQRHQHQHQGGGSRQPGFGAVVVTDGEIAEPQIADDQAIEIEADEVSEGKTRPHEQRDEYDGAATRPTAGPNLGSLGVLLCSTTVSDRQFRIRKATNDSARIGSHLAFAGSNGFIEKSRHLEGVDEL